MPVTPTYPGVYVQELPSGSRTVVGVSTSIAAFVGRALRGPINEPTRVSSFADFERKFGGLWAKSTLSYAVQQFFLAGGGDALIVRVCHAAGEGEEAAASASATLTLDDGALSLRAVEVGTDGNLLSVTVDHGTEDAHFDVVVKNGASTLATFEVTLDESDGSGRTFIEDLPDAVAADTATKTVVEVTALPHVRPAEDDYAFTGGAAGAKATVDIETTPGTSTTLTIEASSEGRWGNWLRVSVDHDVAEEWSRETFNLTIQEVDSAGMVLRSEVHRNVSLNEEGARYLPTVIEDASRLATVPAAGTYVPATGFSAVRPSATTSSQGLSGGADGEDLVELDLLPASTVDKEGLYALEDADLFNLLVLPPPTADGEISASGWATAAGYCEDRRAVCLVDAPADWVDADAAETGITSELALADANAAVFYPWVKIADPLRQNRLRTFPPTAVVAGVIAKTDGQRGVWKAPAGLDARTPIVRGLDVTLTDSENGRLNPLGLNCLRTFPGVGTVVWGARTSAGADRLASDWKYLPVRRTALFIEESLYRGLQWAVFEPNDEPLWGQIRLAAGSFMHQMFRQGAFQGATPKEAYLVKCDRDTTTQADIDRGIVNVIIGFAPLKPAEFVIISIQQIAGQVTA